MIKQYKFVSDKSAAMHMYFIPRQRADFTGKATSIFFFPSRFFL